MARGSRSLDQPVAATRLGRSRCRRGRETTKVARETVRGLVADGPPRRGRRWISPSPRRVAGAVAVPPRQQKGRAQASAVVPSGSLINVENAPAPPAVPRLEVPQAVPPPPPPTIRVPSEGPALPALETPRGYPRPRGRLSRRSARQEDGGSSCPWRCSAPSRGRRNAVQRRKKIRESGARFVERSRRLAGTTTRASRRSRRARPRSGRA